MVLFEKNYFNYFKKDQDGRNLPGKVKISAPNLNKLKKK